MIHKVILADNQSVFRTGAARIMAVEDDFRIVGQCDDLPRLMKAVSLSSHAIVVFGGSLHPDLGELVRIATEVGARTVVVLENDESPQEHFREGIHGILHRNTPNQELLRCVRTVAKGQTYVQKRAEDVLGRYETDMVSERVRERLTPKELKILGLILRGYKNREIALELNNSEQVIKNYLRSIFDKTGVSDRLELALFAVHHKLLASAAARANDAPIPKIKLLSDL